MMKKEEQIVQEKTIIDEEKENIAGAEEAIEDAKSGKVVADDEMDSETEDEEVVEDKESKAIESVDEAEAENEEEKEVAENVKDMVDEAKDKAKVTHKKGTKMGSMACFEIAYEGAKDEDGLEYVLEAAQEDKYAPKKTGVYNVLMTPSKSHLTDEEDAASGNHKLA